MPGLGFARTEAGHDACGIGSLRFTLGEDARPASPGAWQEARNAKARSDGHIVSDPRRVRRHGDAADQDHAGVGRVGEVVWPILRAGRHGDRGRGGEFPRDTVNTGTVWAGRRAGLSASPRASVRSGHAQHYGGATRAQAGVPVVRLADGL